VISSFEDFWEYLCPVIRVRMFRLNLRWPFTRDGI
jgi:hypothetical protein